MAHGKYFTPKVKERRARRKKRTVRVGILAAVTAAVLMTVAFAANGIQMRQKNAEYEKEIASLQEQVEEQEERKEDIDAQKEFMQSQEYIEEIAHERLGLVYPNETVFRASDS